uniref:Uncharacterized protein n=1 Tax=Coccolithus braarudii TaxID=221442 RepID=A0A7S0L769_9EUKA|mmetsp:Transcript_24251/g.52311  ORF Transcript_24251/g.52311 Transcript_24251/m.52311 type:complete len:212 (+) Transcript_24251:155-790(+)
MNGQASSGHKDTSFDDGKSAQAGSPETELNTPEMPASTPDSQANKPGLKADSQEAAVSRVDSGGMMCEQDHTHREDTEEEGNTQITPQKHCGGDADTGELDEEATQLPGDHPYAAEEFHDWIECDNSTLAEMKCLYEEFTTMHTEQAKAFEAAFHSDSQAISSEINEKLVQLSQLRGLHSALAEKVTSVRKMMHALAPESPNGNAKRVRSS